MPLSKKQIRDAKEDDIRLARLEGFTKARAGDLLAYSLKGHVGPFRLALVRQEDDGFVTSVTHHDGSELNLSYRHNVKRWVVQRSLLRVSPAEALAAICKSGLEESDSYDELAKVVKNYTLKTIERSGDTDGEE